MRYYTTIREEKKEPDKVCCNVCGKEIEKNRYHEFPDYLHVEKVWGYDSDKDGVKHSFDICEKCYDEFISGFAIKI